MKDGKYTQCAIISCNVSHKKEITSDTLNVQNEESSVIIVSDTLYYFTYVILYAINESIFIVNTTAPITGKMMTELISQKPTEFNIESLKFSRYKAVDNLNI